MIKLLIVDDEPMARTHMIYNFPWEEWGITIIGEAGNGKEALEFCQTNVPDLALIDITMPVMDGFELLEILKGKYPRVQPIILTAHRNFDYAKRAIHQGATGYLLKSPIDAKEMKSVIDQACGEVENYLRLDAREKNQQKIVMNYTYPMRKKFFLDILNGIVSKSEDVIEEGKAIGVNLVDPYYFMMMVYMTDINDKDIYIDESKICEVIKAALVKCGIYECELFPVDFARCVIVIEKSRIGATESSLFAKIISNINNELSNFVQSKMSLITSETYISIEQFPTKYHKLQYYLDYSYYFYHSQPIFIEKLLDFQTPPENTFNQLKAEYKNALDTMNPVILNNWARDVEEFLFHCKPAPDYVKAWLTSLKGISDQEAYGTLVENWPNFYSTSYLVNSLNQLRESVITCWKVKNKTIKVHPQIANAVEYIKQNIDQDLSLQTVAEHVYLSPTYLGRLFKKDMGLSMVDYIIEQRIELAKKLIAKGVLRNYEIAEEVGFNNYSYFCTMFKKLEEKSPNEYRNEVKGVTRIN